MPEADSLSGQITCPILRSCATNIPRTHVTNNRTISRVLGRVPLRPVAIAEMGLPTLDDFRTFEVALQCEPI